MSLSEKKIRAVLHQGDDLLLTLEDGQELRWDAKTVPTLPVNAALRLRLIHPETEEQERNALAAAVLNELLTPTVSPARA